MPKTLSTSDATLANTGLKLYRDIGGAGVRYACIVRSDDNSYFIEHDEDLTDALAAMVTAGTITGAQRTAFAAVAQALRQRARAAVNLTP